MMMRCQYCKDIVTPAHIVIGEVVKTGRDRYAHCDCIDSHGKENTMKEQTQHILEAADSAHQGIDLARSLLQESLGNMGEILTQGCERLGPAPLGSTMRLGQKLKEFSFLLDDLLKEAHGLCVLLGHNLGATDDDVKTLGDMVGEPLGTPDHRDALLASDDDDKAIYFRDAEGLFRRRFSDDTEEFPPGKDEFDDDEQPF